MATKNLWETLTEGVFPSVLTTLRRSMAAERVLMEGATT